MSLNLPFGIKVLNPHASVNEWYGTYNSVAEATATIPLGVRARGLTVGIIQGSDIIEYWWKSGTTDIDLVVKNPSSILPQSNTFVTLGQVVQVGNQYTFEEISGVNYSWLISGILYQNTSTVITITNAAPGFKRLDVFYVTNNNSIQIKSGVEVLAADTASTPALDADELLLSVIVVSDGGSGSVTPPPTGITNHSELVLDDGTNPHGTTKTDVGLGNVPNIDTTAAVAHATATGNPHNTQYSELGGLPTIPSGITNLAYTPSPTNGTVTSDTGTDATIPLADGTNAGLLSPAEKTIISNTSGTNTGDETTSTIQTKRPLKTVNGNSLEGSGDIVVGGAVDSVNGQTGFVTLDADDIAETATRFWLTDVLKTAYDNAVTWISTNGSNLINHLSSIANAHPISAITGLETALDAKQNNSIYITANTTAVNNGRYIANGTLTVSDIVSPVAGSNYEVVVRGGSVTIGGQAYSEGVVIQRIHNGTSWATYVFDSFGTLTITFVASSTISTANTWQGKLVKINTNGFACVLQLNHKVDFVAGKYNGGTVEIIAGSQTRVLADNQFLLTGNYDTLSVVVDPSDDTKSVLYTTIR